MGGIKVRPLKYDLAGRRFDRLLVLEPIRQPGKKTYWRCRCDCGKTFNVRQNHLLEGQESCGCALTEKFDPRRRFEQYVQRADGCWEWGGYFGAFGYGKLNVDGRKEFAHRYSYILHNGPIPDGMCVLHRCDNPPCVRPNHLFLGTQADNMADKATKRRGRTVPVPRERNALAKLTFAQIKEIKERYRHGLGVVLAQEFGVCKTMVLNIVHDRVPPPSADGA